MSMCGKFLDLLNAEGDVTLEDLQYEYAYPTRPSDEMSLLRRNYLASQSTLNGEDVTMEYTGGVVPDNELASYYGDMLNHELKEPSHHNDDGFSEEENEDFILSESTNCKNPLKHESDFDITNSEKVGGDNFLLSNEMNSHPPLQKTVDDVAVYNKVLVNELKNQKIASHNEESSLFKEIEDENGEIVLGMNQNLNSYKKLLAMKSRYSQAAQKSKVCGKHYSNIVSLVDLKIKKWRQKDWKVHGRCAALKKTYCAPLVTCKVAKELCALRKHCDDMNGQSHHGVKGKSRHGDIKLLLGNYLEKLANGSKTFNNSKKPIGRDSRKIVRRKHLPKQKPKAMVQQASEPELPCCKEKTRDDGENMELSSRSVDSKKTLPPLTSNRSDLEERQCAKAARKNGTANYECAKYGTETTEIVASSDAFTNETATWCRRQDSDVPSARLKDAEKRVKEVSQSCKSPSSMKQNTTEMSTSSDAFSKPTVTLCLVKDSEVPSAHLKDIEERIKEDLQSCDTPSVMEQSSCDQKISPKNRIAKVAKSVNRRCVRKRTLMELINNQTPPRKREKTSQPVRKSKRSRKSTVSYASYFNEQEFDEILQDNIRASLPLEGNDASKPWQINLADQPASQHNDSSGCGNLVQVGGRFRPALLLPVDKDDCARFRVYTRMPSS